MNDESTQITTTQQSALDESTDAYQRLFNFLSQFDEKTRDLALADLQTVYDTTAQALAHVDQAQRIIESLKGVVEDSRLQLYLMANRIKEEREASGNMRELGVAVAIAEYLGVDPHYARPLLDAMMGIEEDYWVDENIIDNLRESVQRIANDMQEADMLDAYENEWNAS